MEYKYYLCIAGITKKITKVECDMLLKYYGHSWEEACIFLHDDNINEFFCSANCRIQAERSKI